MTDRAVEHERKRDAIASVARDLSAQSGGAISQSQAEARVTRAVVRGERERGT